VARELAWFSDKKRLDRPGILGEEGPVGTKIQCQLKNEART
jgi:hypothetical protein